jgi:DNA-binding MarR family transcriptional regulator
MDEASAPVLTRRAPEGRAAGAPGYALDSSAGHMLRRAHQRYQAMFQDHASGLGLTGPQFAALLRVAERGRVTQNLLGRLAAMDSATVQGVVRRLEARGLVQGASDPLDRRTRVLTITAHGAEVLAAAAEAGRRANDALLDPLSDAERRQLLGLLQRLAGVGG